MKAENEGRYEGAKKEMKEKEGENCIEKRREEGEKERNRKEVAKEEKRGRKTGKGKRRKQGKEKGDDGEYEAVAEQIGRNEEGNED